MYASLLSFAHSAGYPALVLLVLAESAGVPVPGETALIAAAVLAGQHRLDITLVIILAAAAAIIGDNLGYLIGRKGGRWLLQRPGPFARQRLRVLDIGDPFFARHGPKAVFLGRWILGLRTWAPWLAGASRMPRRRFVVWNAAGAISWAATLGLIAYFAGHSATGTAGLFAFAGLIGALAAPVALIAGRYRRRHFPPPGSGPATTVVRERLTTGHERRADQGITESSTWTSETEDVHALSAAAYRVPETSNRLRARGPNLGGLIDHPQRHRRCDRLRTAAVSRPRARPAGAVGGRPEEA